jgi:CheY-like chemotaxis protein
MDALILDNRTSNLKKVASAAEELGYTVRSTPDPEEFLEIARESRHKLQIVDFRLDGIEQQVGMRDGLELVAVSAAESSHTPTVFFTNWSGDAVERLGEFDPRLVATMMQKPVGHDQTDWRDRLGNAIRELRANEAFEHPAQIGLPIREVRSKFFLISVPELHTLDEDSRDALELEATEELHAYLDSAWTACDDDWLMISRVDDAVLIVDRGLDRDLPGVGEVRDLEAERQAGILTVGRPTFLEEVADEPIDCTPAPPRNWRRYPFVTLIVGGEAEREFHLDTGAPRSHISREFVLSATDAELKNPKPGKIFNFGRMETRHRQPVELPLHVVGPQGNFFVSLTLQAVKNWHDFEMLNPRCGGQRCPRSGRGQCGRRIGLLGRDLLYELDDGTWQFDPSTGQFFALGL